MTVGNGGTVENNFKAQPLAAAERPNSVSPVDIRNGPDPDITARNNTTPYTNTTTPSQGSYSPEYFAREAFRVPAATTSPATPNTPAPRDTMADRGNSKIAGYQKATADAKTKFANDLKEYGKTPSLIRSPEKDAQIREYGKTLNLNEDQINAAMRGDTKLDAKSAAASTLAYEKNASNKPKKDKEELPAIKQARIAGETAKAAFEEAYGKTDTKGTKRNLDELRSKTEKAAAESKAARDVTAAASQKVEAANKKIKEREANEPARLAKMNKDYEDNRKANEIIKAGSNLNMQDILRNSEDAKSKFSNPFSSSTAKDIKSPEFDLAAFEARKPDDPNFGQKVYKSQYDKDGNFTQQPNDPNDSAFGLRYSDSEDTLSSSVGKDLSSLGESAVSYNKNVSGGAANVGSFVPNVLQNLIPGETGRFLREEINPAQKAKDAIYNTMRFLPKQFEEETDEELAKKIIGRENKKESGKANPQASVNTKKLMQKSATDVLSFSDNLNKYLV